MPKITDHGGPTDQTFPPLDPREHGDQPATDPVDAEGQRKEAEAAELQGDDRLDVLESDLEDEVDDDDEVPVDEEPPVGDDVSPFLTATGDGEVVRGEEPPVGKSIDEVKTWVGDDYVKAERALEAERAGKNRSGLVSWLEKVAAAR